MECGTFPDEILEAYVFEDPRKRKECNNNIKA